MTHGGASECPRVWGFCVTTALSYHLPVGDSGKQVLEKKGERCPSDPLTSHIGGVGMKFASLSCPYEKDN